MAKTQISLFLYQYISQPKMYVHANNKGSNCSCTVQANLKVIRDIFRGAALPFPKGINS